MDKIRWIASYPKSGNTWVRFFLNAYLTGKIDINSPQITEGDTNRYRHQMVATMSLEHLTEVQALQYRYAALMNTLLDTRTQPVFLKTHHANVRLHGIDMIPLALTHKAVYIVRDPRDIAVSWASHQGSTLDKAVCFMADPDATLTWEGSILKHYIGSWSNHVKSWLDHASVPTMVVRYEDMVEDPEESFTQIVKYFDLAYDRKKLIRAIRLTELEKLREQERKYGFREKIKAERKPFFGNEDKEVLSDKQSRRIEFDHGEFMKKLNYGVKDGNSNVHEIRAVR